MVTLVQYIKSDIQANPANWKGMGILLLYRVAHATQLLPRWLTPLGYIYIGFYKLLTELVLGTEIHWRCRIGPRARLYHGYGLVIHSDVVIGSDVILRHGITIGMKGTSRSDGVPVLGNHVNIGASAIILGKITIGDGATIGAGSVVTRSVRSGCTVVGNPARPLEAASDLIFNAH
jgi:serine acetyltransferase